MKYFLILLFLPLPLFADSNPLGTVSSFTNYGSCPSGNASIPVSACYNTTITCPNAPDLVVHLKVTEPASASTGTIVFFSGGSGTGFYEVTYPNHAPADILIPARSRNVRLIQAAWASDVFAGTNGILIDMCRGATLLKTIHDTTSGGNKLHDAGTFLAATGNSGGASVITYAMTRYGGGDWMDCLVPTSGPPIANLAHGCMGGLNKTWAATCNSLASGASCGYVTPSFQTIDGAYNGITACEVKAEGGQLAWARDSVINGAATTSFPQSTFNFIYAPDGDHSEAVTVGQEAALSIVNATITIISGSDTAHDIPNYTNGAAAVATALTNCSYHH